MTLEQKTKAYDEALKRARIWQKHLYDTNDKDYADELNYIFPELAESEDEKSKKWILEYLYDGLRKSDEQFKGQFNAAITWLEKQGNKSMTIDIDIESMVSSYKQRLKSQSGIRIENNPLVNMSLIAFRRGVESTLEELNLKKLEKQGEQKFISSDALIQQRVDTLADIDAKQSSTDNVKPKVKNEIEIPFGAKDSELQEATYHIPKGFHAEIDDDKVVIEKGEKPTAWSKKDEKMFEYALNMIEWYSGKNEDKSRFVSNWLKTLKQRIGG